MYTFMVFCLIPKQQTFVIGKRLSMVHVHNIILVYKTGEDVLIQLIHEQTALYIVPKSQYISQHIDIQYTVFVSFLSLFLVLQILFCTA